MNPFLLFPVTRAKCLRRVWILVAAAWSLQPLTAQVVEVNPVFPKVSDDVTITFNATEGNGALTGISPVYAHAGLITSESQNPNDWKYVQGVWGTPDPKVLMQSLGNNLHSISYNIKDFYGFGDGETVESLAFVFRNANGTIVGRAADGSDIFYPVYPDDVEFQSVLLSPQASSIVLLQGETIRVKGATSQPAALTLTDNGEVLATASGELLEYTITADEAGNHVVVFTAISGADTLVQSFAYTVIAGRRIRRPGGSTGSPGSVTRRRTFSSMPRERDLSISSAT